MPTLLCLLLFSQTTLFEDRAIYKLKNEVIFESDLASLVKKYRTFRCLKPNSALFSGSLKNNFLKELDSPAILKKSSKAELLEFLKIEKIVLYAQSQDLGVDVKKFKSTSKCQEQLAEQDLKAFLSFDVLLETRFSREGKLLDDSVQSLIDTIDHQYPHELFL